MFWDYYNPWIRWYVILIWYYMIFCVFVIWDYDKIRCYINIMMLYYILYDILCFLLWSLFFHSSYYIIIYKDMIYKSLICDLMIFLLYYYIYMIIINFDRSLFFGLYWSYVDFFRALLYIIYIIIGLGIYSMCSGI